MASTPRWQDQVGLKTIQAIVKQIVPTWTNGLHAVQLELVSGILNGRDILCCTATGDGKSAAFAIPCLVLLEYNKNPETYHRGLPTRAKPIGIVITPTKGLANNIVDELSKLNVSGFSYCAETLTEARKTGLHLAHEIKECIRWQVVCVDPEHLCDKEWREITEGSTFRSNVLFACVDEAHLINSWGLSFRPAFRLIGTFLLGRFLSSISILGLTATLEPGLPTESLLPYLASGQKTIIHCQALRQVLSVHTYLWRAQPDGADKLIRAQIYHAICTPKYNQETIHLIETDPRCQIVIATVAFSNGLNAKTLLDSLSLEFAPTLDEAWQEKGRVGRNPDTIGRGIIFIPNSMVKIAETYLKCESSIISVSVMC
ncbi:P-loop containing nucleoside triphosphate hydrolase protein [Crassisporium funariophilum]|nr:P-loop containing nucleoside triphosphate hydrolase protein [Crassisporium funariophilum]